IFEALLGIDGVFESRMLYVRSEGASSRSHSLWIADSDGDNAQRILGPLELPILSPVLSPDGLTVAYGIWAQDTGRDDPTLRKVYLQTLATGVRTEIMPPAGINGGGIGAPAFSADGRYLALTVSTGGGNYDIFIRENATGVYTRLTQ